MCDCVVQTGRAEVTCEEAVSALRKAAKWAQMGLVVSTGPPVDAAAQAEAGRADKKKSSGDAVCKEKNVELARYAPWQPSTQAGLGTDTDTQRLVLVIMCFAGDYRCSIVTTWS